MARLNPEDNYITQSLSDRLEAMQANLNPGPPTFANYFTNYHNQKTLKRSYQMLQIGLAAQETAQQQYQMVYDKIERKMEDMMLRRPYLKKEILGQQSAVKKSAEMTLRRGFRNQAAYANSIAQRGMGAAVTSTLAKTKEQQKQKVAASTAQEMAREKLARRQLYNQVINKENQMIQGALSNLQQLASAQGGIGLSGLQTGVGGMLGAGAGIAGLGQRQGDWSLHQQEHRTNMQGALLGRLAEFGAGQTTMRGDLGAARIIDRAERDKERDTLVGGFMGAAGGVLGFLSANTGVGQKVTEWAGSKVSGALGAIFGEPTSEKGTA